MNFLYLICFISFPKLFRTEFSNILVLTTIHTVWIVYLLFIIAPSAIFYSIINFILMIMFLFLSANDPTRYLTFLRLLFFATILLMAITLTLNLFNYNDLSNMIKSATLLPTVQRTTTEYSAGAVLPLIFGEYASLFNRNVLYFDQPSTFALFFISLVLGMKISQQIRYATIYSIFLLAYTPAKVAVIYVILAFCIDCGLFTRQRCRFLSVIIPIFSVIYLVVVGKYIEITTLDYGDTFSARFYWTHQLATNFQPFQMEDNCISDRPGLCIFAIYDGFALKLPVMLLAAVSLFFKKYYNVSISLLLSVIISIQYGINLYLAPIWVILFVSNLKHASHNVLSCGGLSKC